MTNGLMPITQHRTQLYLPDFLYQRVRQLAQEKDISMAEFIRVLLEEKFKKAEKERKKAKEKAWKEFFQLAGIGKSGLKDISTAHDRYLAKDEIESWVEKK